MLQTLDWGKQPCAKGMIRRAFQLEMSRYNS